MAAVTTQKQYLFACLVIDTAELDVFSTYPRYLLRYLNRLEINYCENLLDVDLEPLRVVLNCSSRLLHVEIRVYKSYMPTIGGSPAEVYLPLLDILHTLSSRCTDGTVHTTLYLMDRDDDLELGVFHRHLLLQPKPPAISKLEILIDDELDYPFPDFGKLKGLQQLEIHIEDDFLDPPLIKPPDWHAGDHLFSSLRELTIHWYYTNGFDDAWASDETAVGALVALSSQTLRKLTIDLPPEETEWKPVLLRDLHCEELSTLRSIEANVNEISHFLLHVSAPSLVKLRTVGPINQTQLAVFESALAESRAKTTIKTIQFEFLSLDRQQEVDIMSTLLSRYPAMSFFLDCLVLQSFHLLTVNLLSRCAKLSLTRATGLSVIHTWLFVPACPLLRSVRCHEAGSKELCKQFLATIHAPNLVSVVCP